MKKIFMLRGLMCKFLTLATILATTCASAFAQLNPPELDEYSFYSELEVGDICHNYAYEFKFPETWNEEEEYIGTRLIASSVTRIGAQSRIGLRWLDNTDNVIFENHINIGTSGGDVRDVEAAFLAGSGGDIYVFVTYYDMSGTFMYDLFKWDWVSNAVGGTAALNRELNSLEALPTGIYFLQALNQTKAQQYFFKLIKE